MRRRTFMTAAGGCGLSMVAGCLSTGTAPGTESDRHPFANSTLSVRIDNNSETNHDVDDIAREALTFWEEHSREYVDFGVEFDVVERDDPDIVIAYADDAEECSDIEGYSERVLGCAPLIRPGGRVRRPTTAHVVAGHRPVGKIRVTTKHELGHIFGLGHDDEPRWIMSDQPADRIPLYQVRIDIWETVIETQEMGSDGNRLFNDGVEAWQNEEYESSEERFAAAHESYGEMRASLAAVQERTAEFDGHGRVESGALAVETVNLSRLRALLARLYQRASAAEWFSSYMAETVRSLLGADDDAARDSLAEANSWIREYNAVETVELRDVAIALGLVRGTDRDEAVFDDEEDELNAETADS